ncbi:MAG: glucose PTS transporter subunit IIA, partial [Sterolibacterium sp.]
MTAAPLKLDILAPLSGVLIPLESVPDQAFAQKLVGDGVSLDPTSAELLAPVEGIVTQLHSAHHALTITTGGGIEVLIHIGIDTVLLKGEGFKPLVTRGEYVQAGQALIAFDADLVAGKARSLLTQVLIQDAEKLARLTSRSGLVKAGRDVILSLEMHASAAVGANLAAVGAAPVYSAPVQLPNPGGLHARPAAVLAAAAKKFKSDIRLVRGSDEANAKSLVAIMVLSTQQHDTLRIRAAGPDAEVAAAALARLLGEGCGEAEPPGTAPLPPRAMSTQSAESAASAATDSGDGKELAGISASPGLAVGRIFQLRQEAIEVVEVGAGAQHERARLDAALHEARQQIEALKANLDDPAKALILDAHQELLEDPDLIDLAVATLGSNKSAAFAWRAAYNSYSSRLAQLDNPLLRERANDIRDVGRRVLAILAGIKQARIVVPEGTILIAEELTPSDTATLDRSRVLGFCTTTGGATSHVAILARSLGIPAICGIAEAALALENGTLVVLDGGKGRLRRDPSAAELSQAHQRMARQAERREQEKAAAGAPAITTDGQRIEVAANVRNADETREAVAMGGEGVGLLRSEFLFSDRDTAPSEKEQAGAYQA